LDTASPYIIHVQGFYLLLVVLRATKKPVVAGNSKAVGGLTPFTSDSFSYAISLTVSAMLVSMTISKVLGGMGKSMIVFQGPKSLEDELSSTMIVECTTDHENHMEEGESSEPPPKGLFATWLGSSGVFSDHLVVHELSLHS
jgi:hypothetical protein